MTGLEIVLLCLAGGVGAALRFVLDGTVRHHSSGSFPLGTMIINVSGSFVIGFFGTLTLAHGRYPMPETLRLFVMIGLCGGYTTFSSFSLQTLDLLRSGATLRALVNIVASVVLCVAAVGLGHALAAGFNGGARQVAQIAIEEEG